MRTALAALTLTVAGFVLDPDRAYAQEAGQLRVTVRLTDSKAGMTYPVGSFLVMITGEGGSPTRRVRTSPDGTVDTPLASGAYVVESVYPARLQQWFYRWSQRVVVTAGALIVLELTNSNGQPTPIPTRTHGPLAAPFAQYRWAAAADGRPVRAVSDRRGRTRRTHRPRGPRHRVSSQRRGRRMACRRRAFPRRPPVVDGRRPPDGDPHESRRTGRSRSRRMLALKRA